MFSLAAGGSLSAAPGPLEDTDVLIVPILPGAFCDSPLDAFATELLCFLQALALLMETEPRQLTVVLLTRGASGPLLAESTGLRPPAPVMARGLARVARVEIPELPILCLDTDAFGDPADGAAQRLAVQVFCELTATDGTMEVAYREGQRYVPRVQVSPRNQISVGCQAPSLDWGEDGAVLVTGGLGGLGIVTAEALVEAGVSCVVLASRSGRVSREGQGLQERLEALEESKARIVYERCDTSSSEQVAALLQRIRQHHGKLRGIIHGAGILEDRMFLRHDAESMRNSLTPKADGAWYLHEHSFEDPVQVFVCYSSIASLFGNAGQANYVAANAFMDQLCWWRSAQGLYSVSLQWPGVAEVGMAASMAEKMKLTERHMISIVTVKNTIRQVFGGTAPMEAVQVVLPESALVPTVRQAASLLEPLLAPLLKGRAR